MHAYFNIYLLITLLLFGAYLVLLPNDDSVYVNVLDIIFVRTEVLQA